nr:lipid transfer protein 3 [Petunia x hybrida]
MLNKQLLPLLLLCIVAVTTASAATITCSTVYSGLEPCLNYVVGGGKVPSECCNGLKSLLGSARTTKDLQRACYCVKSVASSVTGAQISRAASIPGICKARIPFKISPDVDCSKIK